MRHHSQTLPPKGSAVYSLDPWSQKLDDVVKVSSMYWKYVINPSPFTSARADQGDVIVLFITVEVTVKEPHAVTLPPSPNIAWMSNGPRCHQRPTRVKVSRKACGPTRYRVPAQGMIWCKTGLSKVSEIYVASKLTRFRMTSGSGLGWTFRIWVNTSRGVLDTFCG